MALLPDVLSSSIAVRLRPACHLPQGMQPIQSSRSLQDSLFRCHVFHQAAMQTDIGHRYTTQQYMSSHYIMKKLNTNTAHHIIAQHIAIQNSTEQHDTAQHSSRLPFESSRLSSFGSLGIPSPQASSLLFFLCREVFWQLVNL